jgi:hypothetical protein
MRQLLMVSLRKLRSTAPLSWPPCAYVGTR